MKKTLQDLFPELKKLYAKMPEAIGCVGCAKCCKVQHPHCYSVEFYHIMEELKNWSLKETVDLHVSCVSNYLSNDLNKPCVFLDKNKRCRIYDSRDYNCRAFGIIPKKAYTKRVRAVKKQFPGVRLGLESQSDCCGGIHPETFIGAKKLDQIFSDILDLDRELGIEDQDIDQNNNYMTFHDHYLLFYYHERKEMLEQLTNIKYNCSETEKRKFLDNMREMLEKQTGV